MLLEPLSETGVRVFMILYVTICAFKVSIADLTLL